MILAVHFLFGAALVLNINYLPLALLVAFFSHYLLDSLPHFEYSIENIQRKRWRESFDDFLKVFLDLSLGIIITFFLSKNFLLSFLGGFTAILPDSLILLGLICPNRLLLEHNNFHRKFHFSKSPKESGKLEFYFKGKKISPFWAFLSQFSVTVISVFLFL